MLIMTRTMIIMMFIIADMILQRVRVYCSNVKHDNVHVEELRDDHDGLS